jgi:hypothetical protein
MKSMVEWMRVLSRSKMSTVSEERAMVKRGFLWPAPNSSVVISEGKTAPAFALPDETGATVRLADFTGRKVVLWFYVRDDTPG